MAFFDKQIETIRRQLGGLETSQRVAIGLCILIIGGAILLLTQWSLQREMLPLFAEVIGEDELNSAIHQLELLGEEYEVRDGTIYVRPGDHRRLIMALAAHQSVPKSLTITFEKLINDQNHFASAQKTEWQQNIALMNELALTIQAWPKIKDARVFIAREQHGRRLNATTKPTATVTVWMAPGQQLQHDVVKSLARVVSGAVAGLAEQDVNVVDGVTSQSFTVDDPEDQLGPRLYSLQKQRERELKRKIEDLLSYIPGARAEVSVKLNEEKVSRWSSELAEPAVRREMREETATSNLSSASEPGVSANTSVQLSAGGRGQSSTKEKTETEYADRRGETVVQTDRPPGTVQAAAAAIRVPRSYFVAVLRSLSSDQAAEPPAATVDAYVEEQKSEITGQVRTILDANSEEQSTVVVSVYSDSALEWIEPTGQEGPAAAGSVMDFVSANSKQLGLVALAVLAIGLMMLMVRRGSAVSVVSDEVEHKRGPAGPVDLTVDGAPIGNAASPDAFLIAQETDENSIRARQIAQQVSDLVNDDPEGAAQLVRRWIERDIG